jgi:thioredoxin 2
MADFLHVACPHCNAINRLPAARLADRGQCGKCKKALFTAHSVELDESSFEAHATRSDLPLVVDFWAPWCAPCRMMAPAFAEAAAGLEPNYRLAKVNTEAHGELAARYAIRSIPTLVAFRGGREVARMSGAMGTAELLRWIKANA